MPTLADTIVQQSHISLNNSVNSYLHQDIPLYNSVVQVPTSGHATV